MCFFLVILVVYGMWHLDAILPALWRTPLGSHWADALFLLSWIATVLFWLFLAGRGGKPSRCCLVSEMVLLIIFVLSCSYFPRYGDFTWRKNGRLIESTFAWPFTRISLIPKFYQVEMEMSEKQEKLQITATFRPNQDFLLVAVSSEIPEVLSKHIGSQMSETVISSKESLTQLQKFLSVLPEKLPGKISGKIQVLSDTGKIKDELRFSNE